MRSVFDVEGTTVRMDTDALTISHASIMSNGYYVAVAENQFRTDDWNRKPVPHRTPLP